jgi:D-glycero-D-manno-heptose 1,7-bisphosphate phosphatase
MIRAVFLDRDGVIGENRADHVKSWEEFCFLPGALAALRRLRQAGWNVFVVTNQAIVNRGIASAQVVEGINSLMIAQVRQHGGYIHDVRYCPHDSHEHCLCRKPSAGMLMELAEQWQIDLTQSYLVGDAWTDIAAGRAVNCRCIMVRTGRGAEQLELPEARRYPADHLADDLSGAVAWLFEQERIIAPVHEPSLWSQYSVSVGWGATVPVGG